MNGLPMTLPTCKNPGHGEMELSLPGTPEQAFCGTWYRCIKCKAGVLFTSPKLEAFLVSQRT